ncbi:MAG: ABC transporter permease [Microlunatus sp.]
MKAWETLAVAAEAVRLNRVRSLLTVLGIMIGIASVSLTVGLGQGAQDQVRAQINALGSNLLIVSPGSSTSGGVRGGFGSATTLTRADAAALADPSVAPSIAAVAPVATTQQVISYGEQTWTSSVVAATPGWQTVRTRTLASGRFLTDADVADLGKVVVLGASTASELLSGRNPVGAEVQINATTFTVIGVLAESGSTSSSSSDDDMVIMPWTTASTTVGTSATTVSSIYLQAKDSDALSAAYQQIDSALSTLHGISSSDDADFTITSQESIVEAATATDRTLTVLLGGIAGISLLVGGIGVMNIMLVSVSERIREIGLRKALGAPPRLIRRQFLMEAAILGLAGGILGLGIAALGTWLLPKLIDQPVTMSLWASAGALIVAVGIGLIAGVYPATRAARLAPIDALRRE